MSVFHELIQTHCKPLQRARKRHRMLLLGCRGGRFDLRLQEGSWSCSRAAGSPRSASHTERWSHTQAPAQIQHKVPPARHHWWLHRVVLQPRAHFWAVWGACRTRSEGCARKYASSHENMTPPLGHFALLISLCSTKSTLETIWLYRQKLGVKPWL